MVRAGSARSTSVTAAQRSGARRRISERTSFQRSEILRLRLRMTASFTLARHRIRRLRCHLLLEEKAVGSFSNCRGRRPRRPDMKHDNPSVSLRDPPSLTQGGLLGPRTAWLPCARGAVGVCRLRGCPSCGLPGSSAPTTPHPSPAVPPPPRRRGYRLRTLQGEGIAPHSPSCLSVLFIHARRYDRLTGRRLL